MEEKLQEIFHFYCSQHSYQSPSPTFDQIEFKVNHMNISEFCKFCTYCTKTPLSNLKEFAKNISLYEYNNLYYLVFSNIYESYKFSNLFYTTIAEFSILASTSLVFKSNLIEHGNVIFKANAISNCMKYFG